MRITRGAETIGAHSKTDNSVRKWCVRCGGHLFTEHPLFGVIDVYPAVIPGLPFAPAIHVNYGETVLRLHDGRPKLDGFPREMGGSGALLPE